MLIAVVRLHTHLHIYIYIYLNIVHPTLYMHIYAVCVLHSLEPQGKNENNPTGTCETYFESVVQSATRMVDGQLGRSKGGAFSLGALGLK